MSYSAHGPTENLKERVFAEIANDDVKIYSKAHFALRLILVAVVAILALIISVFLFTIVLFGLRVSGREALLNFGAAGFWAFLRFFPWALLVTDIVLVIALEWLLRRFRFGYRSPVLYLLLGLLAVSASLGFLIDRTTGVNDALLRQADARHLPNPIADLYEGMRHAPPPREGICKCMIVGISGNMITAQGIDQETSTVTTIVFSVSSDSGASLRVGDTILVAGDVSPTGTIVAFGIRPFAP